MRLVERREVIQTGGDIGVLRAERLLADGEGAFVQRLGLGIAALRPGRAREVIQTGGDIRVLRAERLLADGEGAFVQRLGLGIAALRLVELREVIQTGGDIRVIRAERLLADGEGAFGQRLGLGIAALRLGRAPRGYSDWWRHRRGREASSFSRMRRASVSALSASGYMPALMRRHAAGGQILRSDQRLARRHQIGRCLKLPCRSLVLQLG